MNEVLQSVRFQLVNWKQRYFWPLAILLMVLLFNMLIFALLSNNADPEDRITGALASIYITAAITYLVAFTQYFPFAVGLSVTRRAFYSAVVLLAVVEAFGYGALMVVLSLAEKATSGWAVQMRFFDLQFLETNNLLLQWLVYTGPFLALAALFALVGAIYKRWAQNGVWGITVVSTILIGGLVALLTWQNWWDELIGWFAGQPTLALFAGYPALLAALALGGGWLVIRRATV
jgi:hypothetical protein